MAPKIFIGILFLAAILLWLFPPGDPMVAAFIMIAALWIGSNVIGSNVKVKSPE
jgi:hypothetical protein